MAIVVIDGGTTNTRLFLVEAGKIVAKVKRNVGIRNTSIDGDNSRLKKEIILAMDEAVGKVDGVTIKKGIAMGMLTSPLGLHNVPHIVAPVGVNAIGKAIIWQDSKSSIIGVPLGFIPGIKSQPQNNFGNWDIMRGEETLVFGLRRMLKPSSSSLVINLGSHTKLIHMDAAGAITGSMTTMAGELFAAIGAQTVLASSLPSNFPQAGEPSESALMGAQMAKQMGLTRGVFAVRLLDQLHGAQPQECFDYLSGAIAASDLQALSCWEQEREYKQIYLLGNSYRTALYAKLLSLRGGKNIKIVPESDLDQITILGALELSNASELGEVRYES